MRRRDQDGWAVREDAGRGWRRVVASPEPIRIVEVDAIRSLIESGFVVISVGGGGIPVVADANGELSGIAAVIDKDHACSLLANEHRGGAVPGHDRRREGGARLRPADAAVDRPDDARRGEGVPGRGHALPAGQHGAEDRGRGRLPRARRRHCDHHRPGERRAGARRRDGDAHRRRTEALRSHHDRRPLETARGRPRGRARRHRRPRRPRASACSRASGSTPTSRSPTASSPGSATYDGTRGRRRRRAASSCPASSTPTCTSSR